MAKCIYCGINGSTGLPCVKSPTKTHVVNEPGKCIYCGTKGAAGLPCVKSPTKTHVVNGWRNRSGNGVGNRKNAL